MAAPRNTRSFTAAFAGFDATLRELFVTRPKAYFTELRHKLKNLPQTNFDLGCDFAEQGKWQDAAFRFRVALYLQPEFPQAYYNLGCCQIRLGQKAKARQSFIETLKRVPNHTDALFMLSALDLNAVPPAQRPQRMPSEMVMQFFSSIATNYDAIETRNNYQGGRVAFDIAKPHLTKDKELVVVDLGCGTGLSTRPWRPLAKETVGVDYTPAMANAARLSKIGEAPLFDRVIEEDVLALETSTAPLADADVILLVNVAQFLGNLEPVFKVLATQMKPGAIALLSIEPLSRGVGYSVNLDTGRFGHHPDYVKQTVPGMGLTIKHETRAQLYPNYTVQFYVLGK